MAGEKGMPRYDTKTKEQIIRAYHQGESVKGLSREYGISRYAIRIWCGLHREVEPRHATPPAKRDGIGATRKVWNRQ